MLVRVLGSTPMRTRYLDIDDRTEDLRQRMKDEPDVGEDFALKYELSWIYHENALEGVVYSGQELQMALANQPLADATVIDESTIGVTVRFADLLLP